MTQLKIISRQPSIQNIQYKTEEHNKTLSSFDINRLFLAPTLPKFGLMDIKDQHIFYKREKAQFFIAKLQSWNRQIQQGDKDVLNSRTQFLFIQFIYSSMKRICLMNQHQIDKQLQMLYKWYVVQAKKCGGSQNASMPEKYNINEYYDVTKSFKTNPMLLIDQYRRPKLFFKSSKRQNIQKIQIQALDETFKKNLKQKGLNNNFLTQLQPINNKTDKITLNKQNIVYEKQNEALKMLRLNKETSKARQDQLRKYIEMKQMEQQQWFFKLKKGRLLSQNTKNYFGGSFNTAIRAAKTSQGNRDEPKKIIHEDMKKFRIQTSMGNRKTGGTQGLIKGAAIPDISEIGSISLLSNPFQTKLKKKKKNKK